uniref:Cell migration inducing hyaluronidase 1 n=1 Tax=Neolamprologus brichardi TaxID=32507 RepID=A0A3Q4GGR5_NEOBR
MPGHSEDHRVTISYGRKVLLTTSATVHSIEILSGGKLVIADTNRPILLRTKHILIGNKGELHIGSPDCPYKGNLTILLFGSVTEPLLVRFDTYRSKNESYRLAKYVDGTKPGLILAMLVNDEGSNNLEDSAKKSISRLGSKHIRSLGFRHPWTFIVTKGDVSSVVEDTAVYQGRNLSVCLCFFVSSEAEWSNWFDRDDERGSGDWEKLSDLHKAYPDRLCSSPLDIQAETHDGIPSNQTGDVIHKKDKDYGFVCLNKDQTHGLCHNYRVRFLCGKLVRPQASVSIDMMSNSSILELADHPAGWGPGDRVVVASTDYSMHQAEEFTLLPCPTCASNQLKVRGKANFIHMGEEVDGVDMRAEVGLLSRNILLRGEMEPGCYGNEACKFFNFDTFGGHLKVEHGFRAVHISGMELQHMGQQTMGHYPVHFHMNGDVDERGGYDPPTFVSDLSIHHSFSRCVTIHGSNGLMVKDVVGYDTLGHCFFTEDGPEERNTFEHCLGLMVRAGTLLPSDRDSKMCRDITDGAYPGYVPNPRQDCSATSTFWIANPNNNLINCAAAGSEVSCHFLISQPFPTPPTSPVSPGGALSHYHIAGMILDNGVKTTEANNKDKRPFLSLIGARSDPVTNTLYEKSHPTQSLHNQQQKTDFNYMNLLTLSVCSGGTFPDDDGSRQQVKNSLFVGESDNRGMPLPDKRMWGPGGPDLTDRTLPRGIDFPIRGMQIYDGPINVQDCTFRKYTALEGRHTSAFGFRLNNSWQSCPNNNVTNITFDHVPITSRVFFGEPGPWFSKMQMDGDKTTVFHDIDGSVSEYPGAFLVKEDNWLLRHPDCIDVPDWKGAICSGHYAQVGQQPTTESFTHTLNWGQKGMYTSLQPGPTWSSSWTVDWWQSNPAGTQNHKDGPSYTKMNDWINVGLCYPQGTNFTILSDIHNRLTKQTRKTGVFMRTTQKDKINHSHLARGYYYWEEDTGLLFLKVKAHNHRETFAFCSVKGCERVKITAIIPKGSPPSNCLAKAYPKHAELPVVDVPMPRKIPTARLVSNEIKMIPTPHYFPVELALFIVGEYGGQTLKCIKTLQFSSRTLCEHPTCTPLMSLLLVSSGFSADKLAFVGFKGSFHPDWVYLEVDSERAKIHQVLPVPVIHKMKL